MTRRSEKKMRVVSKRRRSDRNGNEKLAGSPSARKGEAQRVTHSTLSLRFSTKPKTWSNLVVNKLRAVKIPPFGPRLYLSSRSMPRNFRKSREIDR